MDYGLEELAFFSRRFISISQAEYDSIKEAKAGLEACLYIEQKFDFVVENYLELESTLLNAALRYMPQHRIGYASFQIELLLFNRRLINLLTVGRTYIDHVKHHVNMVFPSDPIQKRDIDDAFRQQYDNRLGYRVMEALRNFAQHRGFPVHKASFKDPWVERENGEKMRVTVSPYLRPADLRAAGSFKAQVLRELEALGQEFELTHMVREYLEGLWTVHATVREKVKTKAQTWESILEEAIARFRERHPEDESSTGLAAVVRDEDGRFTKQIPIFRELVEYRALLLRKNASLANLSRRYVTNEFIPGRR